MSVRGDRLRRGYEAWNSGDVESLLSLCHPEIAIRPWIGAVIAAGEYRGHDGVRQLFQDARGPWREFRIDPEELVEAGDHVLVCVRISLTDKEGSLTIDGRIAHVLEIRDNLVVSFEALRDRDQGLALLER